jgi:hypothetical protein
MTEVEYQAAKERQDKKLTLLEMIEMGNIIIQLPTLAYPRLRPRYVCSAEIGAGRGSVRLCYGRPSSSAGWISIEGYWGEGVSDDPDANGPNGFFEPELRAIVSPGVMDDYWVDHDPGGSGKSSNGSHDAVKLRLLASKHSWLRIALEPDSKLLDYRWFDCPLHRRLTDGLQGRSITLS